jgi:hypothetical protein
MLRRFLVRFFCGMCTLAALTSCGSSDSAGTAEFATVRAKVTPPVSALDADVATWVDASNVKAPACGSLSFPTVTPNDVTYIITSTAEPTANTGSTSTITASNLSVLDITFTLTPANSLSPALPPLFQTQASSPGQSIIPGSNNVPVRIATDDLKSFLRNSLGALSLNCSNQGVLYSYWAVASFKMSEDLTGKVKTITAPAFLVNFSDFVDP